jgi:hypothetical protein
MVRRIPKPVALDPPQDMYITRFASGSLQFFNDNARTLQSDFSFPVRLLVLN